MNPEPQTDPESDGLSRLDQLLADLALQGLSPDESAELDDLLATQGRDNTRNLSLIAAQAASVLIRDSDRFEPMPDALAARILPGKAKPALGRRRRVNPLPYLGWAAAAASWLFVLWRSSPAPEVPEVPVPPLVGNAAPTQPQPLAVPQPPSPTLEQKRERLLAQTPARPLQASEHPLAKGASGDLVWDPGAQEGYLNLKGLAPTDPKRGVYQLWIFDGKRDQRYPIDGGTFVVDDPDKPTIVPIRAQLPVNDATLFAITLEPPGGVVVSDRQRIMLTSK